MSNYLNTSSQWFDLIEFELLRELPINVQKRHIQTVARRIVDRMKKKGLISDAPIDLPSLHSNVTESFASIKEKNGHTRVALPPIEIGGREEVKKCFCFPCLSPICGDACQKGGSHA